jgi:hypothetical protein
MMNFLNDKFKNMGRDAFIKNAALACLVADLLNMLYIHFYWFKERFSPSFIRSVLELNGLNTQAMSDTSILQYKFLLIGSVTNVLIIFLGFHAFIYFLFIKEVKWTTKYIGGYCLSAVLLTVVELFVFRDSLTSWSLILILSSFFYFCIFRGIKYFKIQER